MPDLIGRLFQDAEKQKRYRGIDEPLLITEAELPKVAAYAAKLDRVALPIPVAERLLRHGEMRIFGKRVHVLR